MMPLVAVVGRPNVGKSTLFNALTKSRDALVFDFPGVTRDRQYGQAHYDDFHYLVCDTGGLTEEEHHIDSFMAKQSVAAIEEANLVLFIVDGRVGLTPGDEHIAQLLRVRHKPVVVVVNKTDGIQEEAAVADFYQLGFEHVVAISASQRRNLSLLLEDFVLPVIQTVTPEQAEHDEHRETMRRGIHFALIGRPNVGKSTLTNRLLGEERVVVYDMPGTTIDSVFIPFERQGKDYTIIDTAGIRRRGKVKETLEKFSVVKTLQAIKDSHVVVPLIDAREGLTDQDMHLIGFAINEGRAVVLAINKWDGMSAEAKEKVKADIKRRLVFIEDYVEMHFISALHGTNVGHLFESIDKAYECAMRKITTPEVTQLLKLAVEAHQPPLVGKHRIKLKYAHIGGHNPPVIVIHGNQVNKLPNSYRRYLEKFYRDAFDFVGTPIRFEFKQPENPFTPKTRVKETPLQAYKAEKRKPNTKPKG